jgi:hypothetical protein
MKILPLSSGANRFVQGERRSSPWRGGLRVSEVILGVATGVKTIIIGIYVFHEREKSEHTEEGWRR